MNSILYLFLVKLFILNPVSTDANNSDNEYIPMTEREIVILYKDFSDRNISRNAFLLAFEGYMRLQGQNQLSRDTILTIIDYSKPSNEERFFVLDIKNRKVLEKTLVAHGKNTGVIHAKSFSNIPHSNQSSLGFFITDQTYKGKHGYSLRIKGVEDEINHKAYQRAIVIHGAHYVNEEYITKNGRLGRSFGCPALSYELNEEVINLIKGKSCIFIYAPDETYLEQSNLINSSFYSQIDSE